MRSGARRLVEAGLVDQAEIFPASVVAFIAAVAETGMRRDCLEKIERSETVVRQKVPQRVVAAGPDDPVVAPLDERVERIC